MLIKNNLQPKTVSNGTTIRTLHYVTLHREISWYLMAYVTRRHILMLSLQLYYYPSLFTGQISLSSIYTAGERTDNMTSKNWSSIFAKKITHSWFQTFAVFCMLYVFFWVILRRLNFICRHFGTLCLFHLHRQVGK